MPTIATEGPFKLVLYANDHPPPHVHVRWSAGEAVIDLRTLAPLYPPARGADMQAIAGAVGKHRGALSEAWDRLHPRREG